MEFNVSVTGMGSIIGKFQLLSKVEETEKFRQALLDSTMVIERAAKENMEEMIYSLPEGWYKRKKGAGLFGKTMGSMNPESPYFQKIEATGKAISACVVSLVHYAKIVHFGLGRGRNAFPRPYLTKALQSSSEAIQKILSKAIL